MPAPTSPLSALAVYAEPLAAGRRVAVFGDTGTDLADTLVELGARSVNVFDPDAARARAAAERALPDVVVRPLAASALDLRDGAFDLVIVPDLDLFDDPPALLSRVRRLVGSEGAALIASESDYYELFDLVALQFDTVRMIARIPFHGVALAELGLEDDAPDVSVDTRLAGEERAPDLFIALASQEDVRLDPYAVVQLPDADAKEGDTEEVDTAHARLAQEQLRANLLASQLEETRVRLAEAEHAAERPAPSTEETPGDDPRIAALEATLAARMREFQDMAVEVEASRAAAEAGRVAAAELEQVALRAEAAERRLAMAEHELAHAHDSHGGELARLEAVLRERAQAIQEHEAELTRRERMVRELVSTLQEHVAPVPPPAAETVPEDDPLARENALLRSKLDKLALEVARREAEAQATAWTVAELEQRLEGLERNEANEAKASEGTGRGGGAELDRALDQIDVLKRALAQEHEELARTRAELQRLRPKDTHSPEPV